MFNIKIGEDVQQTEGLELILILDPTPPEWCQTCGREGVDKFSEGKETICIDCYKSRRVLKKLGWKHDNGLELGEFLSRVRAREEVYGSLEQFFKESVNEETAFNKKTESEATRYKAYGSSRKTSNLR